MFAPVKLTITAEQARLTVAARLQFFKPENYFEVRQALLEAGRQDLIDRYEGLIPVRLPRDAVVARRQRANEAVRGEYAHTIPNVGKGKRKGYRPHQRTAERRRRG